MHACVNVCVCVLLSVSMCLCVVFLTRLRVSAGQYGCKKGTEQKKYHPQSTVAAASPSHYSLIAIAGVAVV